jgi:hypothetical protein
MTVEEISEIETYCNAATPNPFVHTGSRGIRFDGYLLTSKAIRVGEHGEQNQWATEAAFSSLDDLQFFSVARYAVPKLIEHTYKRDAIILCLLEQIQHLQNTQTPAQQGAAPDRFRSACSSLHFSGG